MTMLFHITKEYLESTHCFKKIDTILYVDLVTNVPKVGDTVTTQGAYSNSSIYFPREEVLLYM